MALFRVIHDKHPCYIKQKNEMKKSNKREF